MTAALMVSRPSHKPKICLLQGPPGTGKSHTILGIINQILEVIQMSCIKSSVFPTMFHANRAVQPQKMVRGLKFQIKEEEGLYQGSRGRRIWRPGTKKIGFGCMVLVSAESPDARFFLP